MKTNGNIFMNDTTPMKPSACYLHTPGMLSHRYHISIHIGKVRHILALCFALLLIAPQVEAANRTYDGKTYLYWSTNSIGWWENDGVKHYIQFQRTNDTWTPWFEFPANPTNHTCGILVPTGTYKRVQIRRSENWDWGNAAADFPDANVNNNYITLSGDNNPRTMSFGTFTGGSYSSTSTSFTHIKFKFTGQKTYIYVWGDDETFGGWPGYNVAENVDGNGWGEISFYHTSNFHPIFNDGGSDGDHQFDYNGGFTDGSCYEVSNTACTSVTCPTPTILFTSASKDAVTVGNSKTLTVNTTNAIGSTVTFTVDGSSVGTATVAANGTASVTFTPSTTGSKIVSASVTSYDDTATDSYTLTVNSAGVPTHNVTVYYKCSGSDIQASTTASSVPESGTGSTITAPAINGYTFSSWDVGTGVQIATGTTTSSSITINSKSSGGYTLTANYTQDNYTITLTADAGGSITSATSFTNKHYGDNINITAAPDAGKRLKQWTVTSGTATIASPTSASTTLTITGNATVRAEFESEYYIGGTHLHYNDTWDGPHDAMEYNGSYYYCQMTYASNVFNNWSGGFVQFKIFAHPSAQQYPYGTVGSCTTIRNPQGTITLGIAENGNVQVTGSNDWNNGEIFYICFDPSSGIWAQTTDPQSASLTFSPDNGRANISSSTTVNLTTTNIANGTAVTFTLRNSGGTTVQTSTGRTVTGNAASWTFTAPATKGRYTVTATVTVSSTTYTSNTYNLRVINPKTVTYYFQKPCEFYDLYLWLWDEYGYDRYTEASGNYASRPLLTDDNDDGWYEYEFTADGDDTISIKLSDAVNETAYRQLLSTATVDNLHFDRGAEGTINIMAERDWSGYSVPACPACLTNYYIRFHTASDAEKVMMTNNGDGTYSWITTITGSGQGDKEVNLGKEGEGLDYKDHDRITGFNDVSQGDLVEYVYIPEYCGAANAGSITVRLFSTEPTIVFSPAAGAAVINTEISIAVMTYNIDAGTTVNFKREGYTIGSATVAADGSATMQFTPTVTGTYYFTAEATVGGSVVTSTDTYTLTVNPPATYGVKTNFMDNNHCIHTMQYDENTGLYTYSGVKKGMDTYVQLYLCESGNCLDGANDGNGWGSSLHEWNPLLSGAQDGDMLYFTYNPATNEMTVTWAKTPVTVRFDNTKGWYNVYLYVSQANGLSNDVLGAWPGRLLSMDEEGYYGYTFDGDNINLNTINKFSFNNGASTDDASNIHQTNDNITANRGINCYTIEAANRNGFASDSRTKYTITRNDCSPVEPALNASYTVNDAATVATVTLTTTPPPAAATGATFSYSYRKTGEETWTPISGTTATTTLNIEEDDWFEFRVVISKESNTWTATTTLNIRRKIVIRVKAFDTFEASGMKLYYWTEAHDVDNAYADLTQVGSSKWYEAVIKGRNRVTVVVKGNGCGEEWNDDCNGWKRSVECGPFEDDVCIEITEDYNGNGWKKYFVNNDCGLFYRYQSVSTEGTFYSNYIEHTDEAVSFYVGTNRAINFQNYDVNSSQWQSTEVTSAFSGKARGVYQAQCSNLSTGALSNIAAYTGKYYIRTDIAEGGWVNYRQPSNEFVYFAPNSNFPTEKFNHYWCKVANQWNNAVAEVGNTINPCLANRLGDYSINQAASMRYEYNPETNYFNRCFIKLANTNDFLNIYGATASDPVYKSDGSIQLQENTNAEQMKLVDMGNWVYKLDVQVRKTTAANVNVVLRAMYPIDPVSGEGQDHDVANYLVSTNKSTPSATTILGAETTNATYNLRLIYDYKTNRLMSLWTAPEAAINTNENIVADMMMLRADDNDAQTIVLGSGHKVTGIRDIYSVLRIDKDVYVRDRLGARNYYYWISLPYDCYLTDIFGMEDYGDKWTVQRYRGDKRAQLGYQQEWMTFWAEMNLTPTAKMEANRGYVIRVRLKESDFLPGDNNKYYRYLYFPSRQNGTPITISGVAETQQTRVAAHTCNLNGRKEKDSHWNVVGIPGFQQMGLTTTASVDLQNELLNKPNFYYEWSFESGEGKYTVHPIVSTDRFKPMQAYMMQYYGYLDWTPIANNSVISSTGSGMPRRSLAAEEDNTDDSWIGLQLTGMLRQDITWLRLCEGATIGWDVNTDLSKDLSGSLSVYSIGNNVELAGNTIAPETSEIQIGVTARTEGDYTFSLAGTELSRNVLLVDNLYDTETLLNGNDYTTTIAAGTTNDRFMLRLTGKQDITTGEQSDADALQSGLYMTVADGNLYITNSNKENIGVYTVLGQCLYSGCAASLRCPVASGVYIITTESKTYKLSVNR